MHMVLSTINPNKTNQSGMSLVEVILAVAIGGKLLGISGALLAVPITVVGQIIAETVINKEEAG